jgi:hypothetical protein
MSALTSLLVRDDMVSVRQIEDALQRQVLEGGELDTALLELAEIPENVLIGYRAASFRALPASRDEVMGANTATQSLLAADLADSFQVTPLTHDATTLVLASASPLTDGQVAELSARIGLQLQWRISSELRISAALGTFYGLAVAPRMRELIRRIDARAAGELPIVEPLQITPHVALSADMLDGFDESEDFEAALEAAFDRVSAAPLSASSGATSRKASVPLPASVKVHLQNVTDDTERTLGAAKAESRVASSTAARQREAAVDAVQARAAARPKRLRAPRRGHEVPAGPLTDAVAAQVLDQADERDTVVEVFFRYARQYFDTTVLFTVRDDRAHGLEAYNVPNLPDIREVSVGVLRGSALEDLVRSLLPRVVDLSRKEEDGIFAQAIGRSDTQPCALIPVCIRRRVVSFVYGDRNGEVFQLDDLSPLIGLLPHVSRAFERIIRTRKVLAVSTHRALRDKQSVELGHAPTQHQFGPRLIAAEAAPPATDPEHGGLALAEARTKQALNSLGVPRTAPPPPAPRDPLRGGAPESLRVRELARADVEPLQPARVNIDPPLVEPPRPSKPPTPYFSKPPPGAGRYSNPADDTESSDELDDANGAPDISEPDGTELADDTKPLRRGKPSSGAPKSPAPVAEPVLTQPGPAATSRPPARSSKPPPGAGAYRSHEAMPERISVTRISDKPRTESVRAPRAESLRPPRSESSRPPRPAALQDAAVGAPPAIVNEPSIVVDQRAQVEALVAELCRTGASDDSTVVPKLVGFGELALEVLVSMFPGPLWFDRRRPHARVPLGRDISPIARALFAFGDKPFARFASLLRAQNVEVRYYSTLFVSDRVYPQLLEPLIERLFDDDPQIRLLVRDILPHYRRVAGFSRVAERLRSQAGDSSAPMKARLAALDAITVLRDAMSVPILIELLGHSDKQISVPAQRAIVAITCQDFSKSVKKWRVWYQDNAGRHRVEWLIDALMHSDQTLRGAAGLELQKITQVYYGYVAAAPKREREQAQKCYWAWWGSEGRTKF